MLPISSILSGPRQPFSQTSILSKQVASAPRGAMQFQLPSTAAATTASTLASASAATAA